MVQIEKPAFDAAAFLTHAGLGRKVVHLAPRETFFSQGDAADSVFYLEDGRAKITVVSQAGKEATIALLSGGDFVGKSRSPRRMGCVWPRPKRSPPAAH